jgi:DNA polymerase III epsilon subunit family exonuclease
MKNYKNFRTFHTKTLANQLNEATYIVFDLETTGGNPSRNGITEISAIRYSKGEVLDKFYTLVNPQIAVPPIVRRITGINDSMLKDAPKIHQVMPDFVKFIKDDILVSHNIISDLKFLIYYIQRVCSFELESIYLCTHLLSELMLPKSPEKSLKGLAKYLNLSQKNFHRADEDANCTLKLFIHLMKILKQKDITTVEDAIRIQKEYQLLEKIGSIFKYPFLKTLPQKPGLLRYYDPQNKQVLIQTAQNLKQKAIAINNFDKNPKKINKLIRQSKWMTYEIKENIFAALLSQEKEVRENKSLYNSFYKGGIGHVEALCISKDSDTYRISIGNIVADSLYVAAPLHDTKEWRVMLTQLTKILGGVSKKRHFEIPDSQIKNFLLFINKQPLKGLWKTYTNKENNISFWHLKNLYEKINQTTPKSKIVFSTEQSGVISIQIRNTNKFVIYPVIYGIPCESFTIDVQWNEWQKTIKGQKYLKEFEKIKTKKSQEPLSADSVYLLNICLWFIHNLKQKSSNKNHGEFIYL